MNFIDRIFRKQSSVVSSQSQLRKTDAQGWLTPYFENYYLRKVSGDLYEALREGIPILDAAIRRLISLNGTVKIIGKNQKIIDELNNFCLNVKVNDMQKGIQAFYENSCNEMFEQGFCISEFIVNETFDDIKEIRIADSKDIQFLRDKSNNLVPFYNSLTAGMRRYSDAQQIIQPIIQNTYTQSSYNANLIKLDMSNKMYFSINNENQNPYGISIMRSCEFASKILITMQNSILNVWERFGDPSFHVLYKHAGRNPIDIETRRKAIAADFKTAIDSKRNGNSADFVQAIDKDSDISIKIIGAEGQVLTLDTPARHILEQIISKTQLPAWMLGIYWTTTQGMANSEVELVLQDAKIRQLSMLPEFIRLLTTFLKLKGYTWKKITTDPNMDGDWGITFEIPNLRDVVQQARADFLSAQAQQMRNSPTIPSEPQPKNLNNILSTTSLRPPENGSSLELSNDEDKNE